MTTIQVFDPAMCCPTGICGPEVDPQLVRFAADLDWLKTQGIAVNRLSLSQEPVTFAQDAEVKSVLETKGEAGLPLIKVDGEVKSSGTYPTREELAAWLGVRCINDAQELVTIKPLGVKSATESSACCSPSKSEAETPKKTKCC